MHLFMVQVDYKLRYKLMHGSGYWYRLFGGFLLVQVYSSISHSDSVTVVPSFYLYIRAVERGKDRWLYPPSSCSLLLVVARELESWIFPQVVA